MPPKVKNLDKLSANELKTHLKEIGMSQTGDKGTLLYRCQLHEKCVSKDLLVDGQNPCSMKIGDLRKAVSVLGLSPIGSQDELLASLVGHLELNRPKKVEVSFEKDQNVSSKSQSEGTSIDPIAVARRILALDENDDHEGILNIASSGITITKSTPLPIMRKSYLKLSLLVHPDKLGGVFENATKAFQALVRAFEQLSAPDISLDEETDDSSKGRKKGTGETKTRTIARSNEGCFRTRVCCPRCKQSWSEGTLDGNPEYFYNFLMSGLKQYTCSTCLFEFGCLTAIHKCPFCKGIFEYSPQDYHRKINCGNEKCKKSFGFYMFSASDRVIKEMKKEVKEEQERRLKAKETKQRRAARRQQDTPINEEKAFMMGLVDTCPRCGESLEEYEDDAQRRHLMECTDESKHSIHHKRKEQKAKMEEDKRLKQEQQESVQARAAWEFLGAKTNQLWLLDDTQLRNKAMEAGLDATGDTDDLIAVLAANNTSSSNGNDNNDEYPGDVKAITDGKKGSDVSVSRKTSKRRRMSAESVPSNYQSLGLRELKAVCASHGFKPAGSTKADIIAEIEEELCSEQDHPSKHFAIDLT
eukprot:gene2184-4248_t